MKIHLKDLKRAIEWFETNTNADKITLYAGDNKLSMTVLDKYSAQVEILLYEDSSMLPKIKKTDVL